MKRLAQHFRDNPKCFDAITVPAGALLVAILYWHHTKEPTEPAPEPVCLSVPYTAAERGGDCFVVELAMDSKQ